MIEPEKEKWQKKKRNGKKKRGQRERKTYCLGVWRKRVAHNIGIIGHNTLPSKIIRAISINCSREMWRVNELTGSRLLLLQFSTIRSHEKQGKGKGEK